MELVHTIHDCANRYLGQAITFGQILALYSNNVLRNFLKPCIYLKCWFILMRDINKLLLRHVEEKWSNEKRNRLHFSAHILNKGRLKSTLILS